LDEDDDGFFDDIKTVSFNDYLNQNKESEWKLRDGRLIVDIVNIKTAELIKLASEKEKKERTQFTKSVIRYVLLLFRNRLLIKKNSNIVNTD
jgi:hypothetical protein